MKTQSNTMTEAEITSRLIPGTPEEWLSYVVSIEDAEPGRDKLLSRTRQKCHPLRLRWVLVALVILRLDNYLGRHPERVNIQECVSFKIGNSMLKDMMSAGILLELPPPPGSGRKRYAVSLNAQPKILEIAAGIAEMIGRIRSKIERQTTP